MNTDWKTPSPYKVSTMTVCSKFTGENFCFDLKEIFDTLKLSVTEILTMKFMGSIRSLSQEKKKPRAGANAKVFPNQITFVLVLNNDSDRTINLKLFKNGQIQITGCKKIEDADYGISLLLKHLRNSNLKNQGNSISNNVSFDKLNDDNIKMINSNYYLFNRINLFKLDKIMTDEWKIKKNKNIFNVFYDPCNYPGINMKFFYKESYTVSIFIFSTGNVNITGARSIDQIEEAYKFVNKMIENNIDEIIIK